MPTEDPKQMCITLIVAYGGGLNSTALLIQLVRMQMRPEHILTADTGSELPETEAYISFFGRWLQSKDFPQVTIVKRKGKDESLYDEVRRLQTYPSGSFFGLKTCRYAPNAST